MLYQTVLLALDPIDERSHRLLVKAGVIAKQNNADLHIAYVEPGMGNTSYNDLELELGSFHDVIQFSRFEELAKLAKESPYPIRAIHMTEGNVTTHLLKLCEDLNANLVIFGKEHSFFSAISGVEAELRKHASIDVMFIS